MFPQISRDYVLSLRKQVSSPAQPAVPLCGLVSPSSPALWSCTPLLTISGPAVSQACLTAALAFSILCPSENQDGFTWVSRKPGFSASPSLLAPPTFPGALQVLGDSWAFIRPTQSTSVLRALIQVHHVPVYRSLGPSRLRWMAKLPFTPTKQPEDPLYSSVTHTYPSTVRVTST